jgi:sugar/nucleoside kinase (ribokinase family)
MVDTVQMNEEELKGLSPEQLSEDRAVGHLMSVGARGVIITRGERGLTVYASEHKKIIKRDLPASPPAGAAPARAPGDVFGAAFLYHTACGDDLASAARYGIEAVGRETAEPLDRLRR